ncbi:sensor signal transduction histidine kinase [Marinobacter santoriniensis NKSG1]|uniref:histidine kinase n=2 Tax=Marinobacter santoriniensis TaxID=523742 RepID=M7D0I7_9GAMM|nr:ATP-binding protein [Marinobacter santoriniensis]EMP54273.1 sensor signal transduction histidine kinase [Marinobacter santoriniensis NKSG1]
MLRTLYGRLALALFLLLVTVGGLFTVLSLYSVREYTAAVNQELNRDLARNLVSDRNLVTDGQLNRDALKKLFELYMTINPSIEIYLLDSDGRILSYSADPDKIKRKRVSLAPIRELLSDPQAFPLLGDDPRSHDRRKVFSVTPVPSEAHPTGYLYVVLRGEEYDLAESMVHSHQLLQMGAGALAVSLFVGLLAGLLFFRLLTRRLARLTERVEAFEADAGSAVTDPADERPVTGDDIDYLSARFDQMSRRIVAQLELLKDKDHQRRQLVAQVSHDLRTPLASVQGYLEALKLKQDSLEPAEQRRFLEVALSESRRLARLVDELFELAALEAREKQAVREPFAVAELVHDVVQKHQPEAEQAGVPLQLDAVEPARAMADIALCERILDNLIGNAINHSPEGQPVTLSVRRDEGGVVVSVADAGSGIAPDQVEHVFEPFYQGSARPGHAGLGLAIAHRLAALQDGRISVCNRPAGGAEFRVWLPLADQTAISTG